MPISLVRALTENASTPAMPTAAMITANAPNDDTSAAFSRRGATLSSRIWSTVRTFSIGPPGATLRTTRVAAGTSEGASVAARITSPAPNSRVLIERLERHSPRLGVEPAVLRVAHYADHRAPVAAQGDEPQHVAGPRHPLADRIAIGKEPGGERLVEDDHQRTAGAIGRGELPCP